MAPWVGPLAGKLALWVTCTTPLIASIAIVLFAVGAKDEDKNKHN